MPRFRSAAVALALFTSSLVAGEGGALAGIPDLKGTKPGDLTFPQFDSADSCITCHGGGIAGDTSFLPWDTWGGTMMANAARDPVFFAALSVANQDAPGVGSYCLHCHSPIGFVEGHATPPDGSAFDDVDKQGVGCETCHRATQTMGPEGPYYLSDAQLVFVEDPAKHGPYEMVDSPAHTTVVDDGLAGARFCGQCHQVTNPDVHLLDAGGKDTGLEFPLDTTFAEWEKSDYGKAGGQTCQDCHMPKKTGMFPISNIFDSPLRTDAREHGFVGGNHWGIQAVMAQNPDRATKYPKPFELALQKTLDSLASAVKVTILDAPTTATPGGPMTVKVHVENLTGHKFPTGYAESRRAWVGVSLVDATMTETPLAGGYDAATGEIQATPPTHVYRARHGKWDGTKAQAEEHLVQHDVIVSDTRIPPKGFIAGPTTTPTSEIDFGDGNGGYKSSDDVTLTLTAPAGAMGDLTLSARVYYQSMTKEHVDFLKTADKTDTRGADLETIYTMTGSAAPLLIAKAEAKITFPVMTGAGGGAATSTSSAAATSGSGGSGGGSSSGGSSSSGCGCSDAGAPASAAGAMMGLLFTALASARRRRNR